MKSNKTSSAKTGDLSPFLASACLEQFCLSQQFVAEYQMKLASVMKKSGAPGRRRGPFLIQGDPNTPDTIQVIRRKQKDSTQ